MKKYQYNKCTPSYVFNDRDVELINEMYVYRTMHYENIASPDEFLLTECAGYPDDSRILALSMHDGHGKLWGIVLIQYPFWKDQWQLLGHYGHYEGSLLSFETHLDPQYYEFIQSGVLPKRNRHQGICVRSHDIFTLGDIRAEEDAV